jgi:hypothetical protein
MKLTYSESFIEQALVKVYSRGKRTIQKEQMPTGTSALQKFNINLLFL